MKRPEEIILSRGEGEALIERLEGNALTVQDWQVLVQVLRGISGSCLSCRKRP